MFIEREKCGVISRLCLKLNYEEQLINKKVQHHLYNTRYVVIATPTQRERQRERDRQGETDRERERERGRDIQREGGIEIERERGKER